MSILPENQIRSALFVDFDNVFTALKEWDPEYAQIFTRYPIRWLNWMMRNVEIPGVSQGSSRRVLVRKCYLNPQAYSDYRPYFIKAAFDVIDCPPLTQQGKTSTDIHLVMDVIEALNHSTHFDEFILFSGDADFTPLLIKLRENDRITTVLSTGFTSLAYLSACTHLIDRDRFVEGGLQMGSTNEPPRGASSVLARNINMDDMYKEASKIVLDMVGEYQYPVPFAPLAQEVHTTLEEKFGPTVHWYGHEKFSSLLAKLELANLEVQWNFPGYVYDPQRHDCNTAGKFDAMSESYPDIADVARKVHELTDTPYLLPEHYDGLFVAIADEVTENGFSLTRTSKRVRDRCRDSGLPVSRAQVNFVLIGIGHTGHRYGATSPESPLGLATSFAKNVHYLCNSAQYNLTEADMRVFLRWLLPRGEE